MEARALAGLGPDAARARPRRRPPGRSRPLKKKSRGSLSASAAQVQGGNAQEVRYGMCMPQCKNMWRPGAIARGFCKPLNTQQNLTAEQEAVRSDLLRCSRVAARGRPAAPRNIRSNTRSWARV